MNKIIENSIAIILIVLATLSIIFGSYLPLVKAQCFIDALMELQSGKIHSVEEFKMNFDRTFKFYSPVGKEEITKFLLLVGLEKDILDKTAGNLSSGQFQRMLVAWVLISHPQIIFFDEPTTGIDIGGGETIYSLLNTIWKKEKLTMLLVTHDLSIVYKHSTNVLCLTRKRHSCYGAPKEILNTKILEQVFGTEIKIYEHK